MRSPLAQAVLALAVAAMTMGGCQTTTASAQDIIAFESRADMCAHWAGEDPYDAARAADISHAIDAQRCTALLDDGARLRSANRSDTSVIARIDAALLPFK